MLDPVPAGGALLWSCQQFKTIKHQPVGTVANGVHIGLIAGINGQAHNLGQGIGFGN